MKKVLSRIFFPFVNEKYQLENKWWHRLIKVIFIIAMMLSFVLLVFELRIIDKTNDLFSYTQKSGFGLIPTASASNDYMAELEYDIKNGATSDEIIKSYPEVKWNTKLIDELMFDIQNWATLDEVKSAYPELWQTQPTQEKPWFLDLWKDIWLLILFLYFINIWLQFIYYNMFLYIMYWKK